MEINKWIKSVRADTRELKEGRSTYDKQKVKCILFENLLVFSNLAKEDLELTEEYEKYLEKSYFLVYVERKKGSTFIKIADLAFEISERIKKLVKSL
jgi:hypothetical protein